MMMDQAQLATLISNAVAQQLGAVFRQQQFTPPLPNIAPGTQHIIQPLPNIAGTQHINLPLPNIAGTQPPGFNTPTLTRTLSGSSSASTEVQRPRSSPLSRSSSLSRSLSGTSVSDNRPLSKSSRKRRRDYDDDETDGEATVSYHASSSTETEDEEESQVQDEMLPSLKKRPRIATQLSKDRKFIAPHVIDELDDDFLKKRTSPLFRRMLKRTLNPDGSRSLKKIQTS